MKIWTPSQLYGGYIILFLVYTFVVIPILSTGHSGGEQVPLTLFAEAAEFSLFVFFFLSVLTTMLHFEWFKKYWYINVAIFAITAYLIPYSILFKQLFNII